MGPRKWLPHLSFCYAAAAGHSIVGCIISNLNTYPHTHLQPTVVGRRWNMLSVMIRIDRVMKSYIEFCTFRYGKDAETETRVRE